MDDSNSLCIGEEYARQRRSIKEKGLEIERSSSQDSSSTSEPGMKVAQKIKMKRRMKKNKGKNVGVICIFCPRAQQRAYKELNKHILNRHSTLDNLKDPSWYTGLVCLIREAEKHGQNNRKLKSCVLHERKINNENLYHGYVEDREGKNIHEDMPYAWTRVIGKESFLSEIHDSEKRKTDDVQKQSEPPEKRFKKDKKGGKQSKSKEDTDKTLSKDTSQPSTSRDNANSCAEFPIIVQQIVAEENKNPPEEIPYVNIIGTRQFITEEPLDDSLIDTISKEVIPLKNNEDKGELKVKMIKSEENIIPGPGSELLFSEEDIPNEIDNHSAEEEEDVIVPNTLPLSVDKFYNIVMIRKSGCIRKSVQKFDNSNLKDNIYS